MSGCCCCNACCAPTTTQPPQPPAGKRCDRYKVTIESINVTAIDDGFLGGTLEMTFTFLVNGQVQTWVNNNLDTGVTSIGLSFFADVPADSSTITVEVSGVEADPFFNDPVAGFTQVWGQAQNWGAGGQSGGASDSNITYTLNYTITCAHETTIAISRAALLAYAQEKAQMRRRKADNLSSATLLGWSLDRLRRSGWQVVSGTDQHYLLRGHGILPAQIERKFGREEKGKA